MYHESKVKKGLLGIPKYIFMLFFVLIAVGVFGCGGRI